jgi:5-formyltetrahydrofolate cyclo-ligase
MYEPNTDKDKLRSTIRQKRTALSKQSQQQKSEKIINHVLSSSIFRKSKNIAFYFAVYGEADPSKLVESNLSNKKQFYLPVLSTDLSQGLLFAPTQESTQYSKNNFSIPEPICDKSDLLSGDALDLVIVPLLGFDQQGNRLGMGGGFYDRSFAFKKDKQIKPILMGFSYDFQEVDALQAEDWDVPLDFIATEKSLRKF